MSPYKINKDHFECQMATNYIGHYALNGMRLPLLIKTANSRVITLSCLPNKWAEIQFDDIYAQKGYSRRRAFGQSKRACLIFAFELQRRLTIANCKTIPVAARPMLCKTNLDQYFSSLIRPLGSLFLQRTKSGAMPVLYALLNKDIKGGEFIGPGGFQQLRGCPTVIKAHEYSINKEVAQHFWKTSQEMTNVFYLQQIILKFPNKFFPNKWI